MQILNAGSIDFNLRIKAITDSQSGEVFTGSRFTGVDVGKNYLCYVVRRFGDGLQSSLEAHGFIHGGMHTRAVWDELRKVAAGSQAVLVDSGYKPEIIRPVCRHFGFNTIRGATHKITGGGTTEMKNGIIFIDSLKLKHIIWRAVADGLYRFPLLLEADYKRQFASEYFSNQGRWQKHFRHNHYFDAEMYAMAGRMFFSK